MTTHSIETKVSGDDVRARLEKILSAGRNGTKEGWRVLDAGCGAELPLDIPDIVELVGIDTSPDALARNTQLDSAIVGDLQTYPLPSEAFDLVICWNVLEHIPRPDVAVVNLSRAIRPGGLLVLKVPNIYSLKGLITRLTPHRFHVWVYRRLLGYPTAGRRGFGPYPTHIRRDIAPLRLTALAQRSGFEPAYAATYAAPLGLPRRMDAAWQLSIRVLRALTLGAWDPEPSEHLAVFRKIDSTPGPAARAED